MRSHLPAFVLASLAAHLGIVAAGWQTSVPIEAWRPGEPFLSIDVGPREETRTPSAASLTARATTDTAVHEDSAPSPSLPAGDTQAPSSADRAQEPAAVRNHLLGELQSRLSRHFTYPDIARSRGWEGTVLVALRVEPDGLLDAIQIGRSSGYDVLDRAALRSLRGIERLGEVTELLAGRRMDLELAVVYRLAGR